MCAQKLTGSQLNQPHRTIAEQEGRALWCKEPPRNATFAHIPVVFRTKFGDVLLELDR